MELGVAAACRAARRWELEAGVLTGKKFSVREEIGAVGLIGELLVAVAGRRCGLDG